jgi:hypothetical protein
MYQIDINSLSESEVRSAKRTIQFTINLLMMAEQNLNVYVENLEYYAPMMTEEQKDKVFSKTGVNL